MNDLTLCAMDTCPARTKCYRYVSPRTIDSSDKAPHNYAKFMHTRTEGCTFFVRFPKDHPRY